MEIEPAKQLTADDITLLMKAMEKLKDELNELSKTLNEVAFAMEEEEAQKFKVTVFDVIAKIKRQIQQAP
ncbi:hypothetical protein HFRIS_014854 [Herbaspirillum frisingense GSF30]|uniref:Uncharacterized protein n=1 Tax=Herbaspirillum frisingense GSF30 TaxID=864073 RepID=A0AAI9N318_9BURK|nr:hypothetical protein [Herbaspirillum frisingense]EOA03968.1 hypothetical protein HFRIS_014854 [Herbaspirillum frisingense GSF30]